MPGIVDKSRILNICVDDFVGMLILFVGAILYLAASSLPYGIWLMKNFMDAVPMELGKFLCTVYFAELRGKAPGVGKAVPVFRPVRAY